MGYTRKAIKNLTSILKGARIAVEEVSLPPASIRRVLYFAGQIVEAKLAKGHSQVRMSGLSPQRPGLDKHSIRLEDFLRVRSPVDCSPRELQGSEERATQNGKCPVFIFLCMTNALTPLDSALSSKGMVRIFHALHNALN
jgi:hypothetical protein